MLMSQRLVTHDVLNPSNQCVIPSTPTTTSSTMDYYFDTSPLTLLAATCDKIGQKGNSNPSIANLFASSLILPTCTGKKGGKDTGMDFMEKTHSILSTPINNDKLSPIFESLHPKSQSFQGVGKGAVSTFLTTTTTANSRTISKASSKCKAKAYKWFMSSPDYTAAETGVEKKENPAKICTGSTTSGTKRRRNESSSIIGKRSTEMHSPSISVNLTSRFSQRKSPEQSSCSPLSGLFRLQAQFPSNPNAIKNLWGTEFDKKEGGDQLTKNYDFNNAYWNEFHDKLKGPKSVFQTSNTSYIPQDNIQRPTMTHPAVASGPSAKPWLAINEAYTDQQRHQRMIAEYYFYYLYCSTLASSGSNCNFPLPSEFSSQSLGYDYSHIASKMGKSPPVTSGKHLKSFLPHLDIVPPRYLYSNNASKHQPTNLNLPYHMAKQQSIFANSERFAKADYNPRQFKCSPFDLLKMTRDEHSAIPADQNVNLPFSKHQNISAFLPAAPIMNLSPISIASNERSSPNTSIDNSPSPKPVSTEGDFSNQKSSDIKNKLTCPKVEAKPFKRANKRSRSCEHINLTTPSKLNKRLEEKDEASKKDVSKSKIVQSLVQSSLVASLDGGHALAYPLKKTSSPESTGDNQKNRKNEMVDMGQKMAPTFNPYLYHNTAGLPSMYYGYNWPPHFPLPNMGTPSNTPAAQPKIPVMMHPATNFQSYARFPYGPPSVPCIQPNLGLHPSQQYYYPPFPYSPFNPTGRSYQNLTPGKSSPSPFIRPSK